VMQGGYRKKREGLGFKEKEIGNSISQLEEKEAELTNILDTLEKRRAENEQSIVELRERKAALEGEIIKVEKSLHLEATDLTVSKEKKEELKAEAGKTDKEIIQLGMKISEKNQVLADIKMKKQELRGKISQLRDPALIAELSTFEQKKNELGEEAIKMESEAKNIEMQINDMHLKDKERISQILKQSSKEEEEFKNEMKELEGIIKAREAELKNKESAAKEFHSKFRALFEKRSRLSDEINKNEITVNGKVDSSRQIEIRNNTFTLKNAEIASEMAGLNREFSQYEGVTLDTAKNEEQLKYEIGKFERMKIEIGSVNMRALEIYEDIEKEYNSLLEKKNTLGNEKADVEKMINEIEGKKTDLFMKTFEVVNNNFKNIFTQLTAKGEADLFLENKENPFEGGVGIKVRITGQRFLDIRGLSGGEKTMTALAFIFAIQEHDPASFYVLDEVDAALDKHNSEKLAKLVKRYSEKAQYIMISHNDAVINEANTLYGVSMNEHGISNVVSLRV